MPWKVNMAMIIWSAHALFNLNSDVICCETYRPEIQADEWVPRTVSTARKTRHCGCEGLKWNHRSTDFYSNVTIFPDVAPCCPYVNRRFGATYHLHLQGGRRPAEQETSTQQVARQNSEDGGDTVLRSVISHTELLLREHQILQTSASCMQMYRKSVREFGKRWQRYLSLSLSR
jgi:hypothetical protein